MAVRYVQRRHLNGGGRSIEEAEPPPVSLEDGKYLYSVQREILIGGCKCRSKREAGCLFMGVYVHFIAVNTMYSSPDSDASNSLINGLLIYASGDESETETLPVITFPHSNNPLHYQYAPEQIQDNVLVMGLDAESTESGEVWLLVSLYPPRPTTPATLAHPMSGLHLLYSRRERTDDDMPPQHPSLPQPFTCTAWAHTQALAKAHALHHMSSERSWPGKQKMDEEPNRSDYCCGRIGGCNV